MGRKAAYGGVEEKRRDFRPLRSNSRPQLQAIRRNPGNLDGFASAPKEQSEEPVNP